MLSSLSHGYLIVKKIIEATDVRMKAKETKNGVIIAFVRFIKIRKFIGKQFRTLKSDYCFEFIYIVNAFSLLEKGEKCFILVSLWLVYYNLLYMTFKRTKIKDMKLRTHMSRLEFYIKAMSIYQKDKSATGMVMYDNFKKLAIRDNKELENYLNKPQK